VSVRRTYTLQTVAKYLFHAVRQPVVWPKLSTSLVWSNLTHGWIIDTLSHCRQYGI